MVGIFRKPKKQDDIIFVTIGVPFSKFPIAQKVMMYVDHDVNTKTQVAKKLRKQIADNIENHGWVRGTHFDPSELYYEVYLSVDATVPFFASANSPALNSAV